MPIETPDAIRSRVPPSTRARGASVWRANKSHAAISTAAFAMLCPRIALSAGNRSRGCANSMSSTRGATNDSMMCHAVSFVLEETENPFLADFYADRPGSALQAQLFYLLNRHRQQMTMRQADLFSQTTISDYMFDKDKIFAYLNLDDNELFIYQRLYELLARDVPPPDLVIYLQAPTDVLLRRMRGRNREPDVALFLPDAGYLKEVNEAYHHFFFHYDA